MECLIIAGIVMVFVGGAVLNIWKERKEDWGCDGYPSDVHCSVIGCGSVKES